MAGTTELEHAISSATGSAFSIVERQACSGGCIHQSERVLGATGQRFFVKRNTSANALFAAEARALEELAKAGAVRVPAVVARGSGDGGDFLVLEFIEMSSRGNEAELGAQLASLHRHTSDGAYGFSEDNFIGETPQRNCWERDWVTFYRDHRLQPQLQMAAAKGLRLPEAPALLDALEGFFTDYQPAPSLLHGDLWGGNAGFTASSGQPVLFDPASYYGDREADIAFTFMFGGFSSRFYQAYEASWPLDSGFKQRKPLYNLYHELNHFNLFGGGYANQARATIAGLLAQ